MNGKFTEMKDAGRQRRVGVSLDNRVGQVFWAAGPAACHNWNGHGLTYRRRDLQIVPVFRPVTVHAGEYDLSST